MGVSSEIGNIQKAQLELEMLKAEFKEEEGDANDDKDGQEEEEVMKAKKMYITY